MSWLQTFLLPTQSYLVCFDIASSSQNYLNPNGLQRDREQLFQAIDQTVLVRRCVSTSSVGGQFLGDEYRLAFPLNGAHGSISSGQIVEFVDEVFYKLQSAENSRGYAPVVRALLTKGPVQAAELSGFGYLSGNHTFRQLNQMSQWMGRQVNLLVSDQDLRPELNLHITTGSAHLFVKHYTDRKIPSPYHGPESNVKCTNYIVTAITNDKRETDGALIESTRTILTRFGNTGANLKVTIGPSSVVLAVPESQFDHSRQLLEVIRQVGLSYTQSMTAAIGSGAGQVIDRTQWTTESFESGTAIELSRITSGLDPGSLAIPNRTSVTDLLVPLSRSITKSIQIEGKRDEVFEALVHDSYFKQSTVSQARPEPAIAPPSADPPVAALDVSLRTSGPIELTPEDWSRLEQVVQRLSTLTIENKQSLIIRIAKAGNSNPANSPWAGLPVISGQSDFFTQLFHLLQRVQNPVFHRPLIEGLFPFALYPRDQQFLNQLLVRD